MPMSGVLMKKLRFLVSLTTKDNDYQQEQAAAAERAARKLGVDLEILYADNDAITQSQQLLKAIQSPSGPCPDGIIFEPVGGTGFPHAARAAAAAGISWVVLNRDVEYISQFRKLYQASLFVLTSDHEEIGRIQGRQMTALLPKGGSVLYIQGPAESLAAKQRTTGVYEAKAVDIQIKIMRAQWTEESSYKAVSSWLRLSTSYEAKIDVVAAQDDSMAMGARKAFQDLANLEARDRLLRLPFLGCDGVRQTGQAWVRSGLLAATIVIPPNTDQAIEMLVNSRLGISQPPERSLTTPSSYPPIEALASMQKEKSRATRV